MSHRTCVALVLSFVVAARASAQQPAPAPVPQPAVTAVTAVKAGRLVDPETGKISANQVILVEGEKIKAVRQDEIDAAICLHPEFAVPKSMAWKLLRAEPLVVLAPSHMTHEDPLDLIRREPFVRYDRSLGGGKQADRYLRKRGIAPNERFELSSLLAIALMVHEGLGVSLVPDIQSPLTSGLNICRIPLVDLREPRQFGVLWRRGSSRSGVVTAFLEQAR